ncbi:ferredoxin [Candidatus Poriferisocius sp.]|uniref:ferredoxin n=1 Tax=Candidatus Poriferisocius sp. TaxID=3101276 RepID=UPI003B026A0D
MLVVRIRVDVDTCQGHGRCYVLGPDLFEADLPGTAGARLVRGRSCWNCWGCR